MAQQLKIENYAYVAISGWGSGNTISVIDISTNQLTKTITVADNPTNLVSDGNYLWVLSGGNTIWNSEYTAIVGHTSGALTAINTTSHTIEKTIDFPEGQLTLQVWIIIWVNCILKTAALFLVSLYIVHKLIQT